MIVRLLLAAAFAVVAGVASAADANSAKTTIAADHHQHLLSPRGAALLYAPPALKEPLPADVQALLQFRTDHWNDAAALEKIYAADAALYVDDNAAWTKDAKEAAAVIGNRFAAAYRITPVAYRETGASFRLLHPGRR